MKSILWCAAFAAVFAAGCARDRYYYRTLDGEYAPQTVAPAVVEPAAVVAPAVAPVGGYVEPAPGELSVEGVFNDLSVALATDKHGVGVRNVADALLVAVRLMAGDKTVGTHGKDVARQGVYLYG